MFSEYFVIDILLRTSILSTVGVFWVIFVVRIIGLRTFSKMTAFDFVVTVATGSLLAGACQASDWPAFFQPTMAIGVLLAVQYLVALARRKTQTFDDIIQNAPVLLMRDGIIDEQALTQTRVSRDDLIGKLREANVLHLSQVRAVVLEVTGDISVLHGEKLSDELLDGVQVARAAS